MAAPVGWVFAWKGSRSRCRGSAANRRRSRLVRRCSLGRRSWERQAGPGCGSSSSPDEFRYSLPDLVHGGAMIDAYCELQQLGHFGRLGLGLLFKIMREEVQRFPVLRPGSGWTEDSVWDCTQAFFAERGPAVTVGVLAQDADSGSMSRFLRRSIRNFLISEARKTPAGAVRRKIEDLLAATTDFVQVPQGAPGAGRWQLDGRLVPPFAGELRPLVTAAYNVPGVKAVRWSGNRRTPLASDVSLVAIIRAVLAAAAGSLEVAQLTFVFLRRFPVAVECADATLD